MCLEVYHPELPLIIPYENEIIRFSSLESFSGVYKLLIRNTGNLPLDYFNVLYPRRLYVETDSGTWLMRGVSDITEQLPSLLRDSSLRGDRLTLLQPDPNRPQFDRPPLEGSFLPKDSRILVPGDLYTQGLMLLREIDAGFFQVRLTTPIEPLDARWFCFRIKIPQAGLVTDTPIGRVAIHQLASPVDVRHTVEEKLETGLRRAEQAGAAAWVGNLTRQVMQTLGVTRERRSEIEYYELVVNPGPPADRFLLSCDVERDLRMRSNSPRPFGDELLYEWKSGSILRPDGYPWKNEGFILHLKLAGNS